MLPALMGTFSAPHAGHLLQCDLEGHPSMMCLAIALSVEFIQTTFYVPPQTID